MPAPVAKYDWTVIKSLYLQGIPPKDICTKFCIPSSTLGAKASRAGWTKARRAGEVIDKALTKGKPELAVLADLVACDAANTLQDRGQHVRERLARDIERSIARLERHVPADLDAEELRERTAKMLTDRAMRVFGLEDKSLGQIVMLGLAEKILNAPAPPPVAIDLPKS